MLKDSTYNKPNHIFVLIPISIALKHGPCSNQTDSAVTIFVALLLAHFWFHKEANSRVNCMDLLNAKSKITSFQYQIIFDIWIRNSI